MNTPYPIAKLHGRILIVNKNDLPFFRTERALEVMCIQVYLESPPRLLFPRRICPIIELEKHLKMNPWEDIIDEEERDAVWREIKSICSDKDISEK